MVLKFTFLKYFLWLNTCFIKCVFYEVSYSLTIALQNRLFQHPLDKLAIKSLN